MACGDHHLRGPPLNKSDPTDQFYIISYATCHLGTIPRLAALHLFSPCLSVVKDFLGWILGSSCGGISTTLGGCDKVLVELGAQGIMSTSASASMSASRSSMESHLIKLRFNPAGQPIGPTAATFSTNIGRIVKTHVPPTYNSWKKVPQHLKEDVWKHVLTLFDVSECHRSCVLTRANATWRDWKCDLRRKVYDKYNTDAERKKALPQYLKREDWETFVDSEGSYEAQLRRRVGKAARASLKSPHTSGRKVQARVADELQQQHPEREVTRCEIFMKTHYKKDGTASSHHVERLSRMCEDDPSIAHNDIDNDGVAKVFGADTRGRVRDLGLSVSRSIVHNSNPYKRAYEEEHKSHVAFETEVDGLKSRMADMEKIVASLFQSGTQMRSSTDHESSSQVRPPSTHQETTKLEINTPRDIQVDAFKEEHSCSLWEFDRGIIGQFRLL